jgi:hypothetical protein
MPTTHTIDPDTFKVDDYSPVYSNPESGNGGVYGKPDMGMFRVMMILSRADHQSCCSKSCSITLTVARLCTTQSNHPHPQPLTGLQGFHCSRLHRAGNAAKICKPG